MRELKRVLNSVGKRIFVRYYDEFKNCSDRKALAEKIMKEQGYSSFFAQMTRVNGAIWIFDHHAENDTLGIIIASKRLDTNTINEAKRLKEQHEAQFRDHSFPKVTPEEFAKIIIKDLGL